MIARTIPTELLRRYDCYVASSDEIRADNALICAICERMCDPPEIQTCVNCHKRFCNYCNYRLGGKDYCSRMCGEIFFFGGDFADDDVPEE